MVVIVKVLVPVDPFEQPAGMVARLASLKAQRTMCVAGSYTPPAGVDDT